MGGADDLKTKDEVAFERDVAISYIWYIQDFIEKTKNAGERPLTFHDYLGAPEFALYMGKLRGNPLPPRTFLG